MRIKELFKAKSCDLTGASTVTVAFLGDSVTQGCFEVYKTSDKTLETVFEAKYAYHECVKRIFGLLYPSVPVNTINAGISGGGAPEGAERLERDVLRYNPDLVVVCFGLNDCYKREKEIGQYTEALEKIFKNIKKSGAELIFMTPNMIDTKVSCHIEPDFIKDLAGEFAEIQNGGTLDAYIAAAKAVCAENDVPVCDCYAMWKSMQRAGIDTTELLSNKLNHPARELHWLFAYELVRLMLDI